MKTIDLRAEPLDRWRATLDRHYEPSPELCARVAEILAEVRREGDAALLRFTHKFDGADLSTSGLRVRDAETRAALGHLDPRVEEALEAAKRNVQEFARQSRRSDWAFENVQGARVGERFDPYARVGMYVPAGSAPLVSSAIMTVALASAVDVPEIVAVSPPNPAGEIDRNLLAALHLAGATEIYKLGGAQAIGALAFGSETVRPVVKVFGPGNAYVVEAKRQVFGFVSVDLLPGPSEIMVVADQTAKVDYVAADLLAQAEHGAASVICLVTIDPALADVLPEALERRLAGLRRQDALRAVLSRNASVVIVRDRAEAAAVANAFAPEHLSLAVADPDELAERITTAGAIFLGHQSPVAAGDFLAGPSHALPTGGAGKSFGGLTVDQFQRRTSLIAYDRESLSRSVELIQRFSEVEQLDAHGHSVTVRFEA